MAGASRDVSMANNSYDLPAGSKRQPDKETAAELQKQRLTHQWFDPRRYPDPLQERATQPSSAESAGVTAEMEKKWLDAIASSRKSS